MALNQHVLYDHVSKILKGQTGPVPHLVGSDTMSYAIALVELPMLAATLKVWSNEIHFPFFWLI
jgi:hypothetical protein